GFDVLQMNPPEINNDLLMQFPEFVEFQTPNEVTESQVLVSSEKDEIVQTPEEQIETLAFKLRKSLSDELLETVLSVSPRFFERLVLDLLLKMGYGSSLDSG